MTSGKAWWRHQMETLSALLAFCVGNSPVTGEFPIQRPVTWRSDAFVYLGPYQQLSKQWRRRWFETPWLSLWRHHNGIFVLHLEIISKLEVSIYGLCQVMTQRYKLYAIHHSKANIIYPSYRSVCRTLYISFHYINLKHNAIMTSKCFTYHLLFLWGIRHWITLPSQRGSNADVR